MPPTPITDDDRARAAIKLKDEATPARALTSVGQVLDYCAAGELDADIAHRVDLIPGMIVQVIRAAADGTRGMVGLLGWVIDAPATDLQTPDPGGVPVSFQWPGDGLVGRIARERLRVVGATSMVPDHDGDTAADSGDTIVTVEDDGTITGRPSVVAVECREHVAILRAASGKQVAVARPEARHLVDALTAWIAEPEVIIPPAPGTVTGAEG